MYISSRLINGLQSLLVILLSSAVISCGGSGSGSGGGGNTNVKPIPTLSITNASVSEGNRGISIMKFVVTLSEAASTDVSVDYATSNGSAIAPDDFIAVNNTLTIVTGGITATIEVQIKGDTAIEPNESFSLILSNPSGLKLDNTQVIGLIYNDDNAPVLPTISVLDANINEGDSGNQNLVFNVSLNATSTNDISFDYATVDGIATAGSATAGGDYIAVPTTKLTITAGNTTGSISVSINGDTKFEPDETFTVVLSNPVNANFGSSTIVTGTINNDDTAPIEVSISDANIIEGNSGTTSLDFTVSLSASAPGNVDVEYVTQNGSATADNAGVIGDYVAIPLSTLTIFTGNTSAKISVTVSGDTDVEPDETLTITLSNPANAILGTKFSATGTILDDDSTFVVNDTGVTQCADGLSFTLSTCPQTYYPGQDAEQGRDFTQNDDSDGHAGFSFAQIDAAGAELSVKSLDYNTTTWSCVLDKVTGLMWEVKTTDSGLQDRLHRYTWYNSTGTNDASNPGTENGKGQFTGTCVDTTNCDTEKYTAQVNTISLCGYSDWRLPTLEELVSITDLSTAPAIDLSYFPNITTEIDKKYWSSTQYAKAANGATAFLIDFNTGERKSFSKAYGYSIRLVRRAY